MLITRLLFWLHRLDELDYQVKYWRYFINEPLPEKKWRQFGRRLSNRSRRRVKATTFIVADVPVFMLNWLVPDSRIVGLDIDEKGLRLPKARTLSAKIAFLQPESLVVSPRFLKRSCTIHRLRIKPESMQISISSPVLKVSTAIKLFCF